MAQVDYFLKIDGIDGESQDVKHKNEIDVLSFSWGASQSGTPAHGRGAGAGKVNIQDFSITKFVDKSSPMLLAGTCTGQHFSQATFTARKAGESQQEFLKITFSDLLISSVQHGGSTAEGPMEQVSLSFETAMISVASQDPKGGIGGVETALCGGSKR